MLRTVIGLLLCMFTASSWATEPGKDVLWGELYFGIGPSSEPVLWRAQGRPEHYHTGINLNVASGKWVFAFNGNLAGGATFDNPDRGDFLLSARYTKRNWSVGLLNENHFDLNNLPVVDTHSRRPQSNINSTWLTVSRKFSREPFLTSVYGGARLMGNEPVYSPVGLGKPYATEFVGAYFLKPLPKGFRTDARTEIYANVSFNKARLMLSPGVEHNLGSRIIVRLEWVYNLNAGFEPWQTSYTRTYINPQKLAIVVSLPFGTPHP